MSNVSNSLSMPVRAATVLLTCLTMSNTSPYVEYGPSTLKTILQSDYQTTSSNPITEKYEFKYRTKSPRLEALELFGVQSNFTLNEQKTYRTVLAQKSKEVGINIFDFFV